MAAGHGVPVADLADHDHVGRLAQRVFEPGVQRRGVGANLTLVDDRFLVLEQVLDRVFQRQDVARHALVAVVDQRRQRGAFSSTGGPHHQQQGRVFCSIRSARPAGKPKDSYLGMSKLMQRITAA